MTSVTIHEAKTQLSRLIRETLAGGEVTIRQGRSGEELVKLVPAKPTPTKRQLGWLRRDSRGRDPLAYGFWDPLPDVELALWNGEGDDPDDAPAA
ncbi:MAG TPA: antitoxin [Allosphingosinicella sp.]|nr:antitoxin [Allosphingosinicella sp.]